MWYDELIYNSLADAQKWNPRIDAWRKQHLGSKVTQVVDKLTMLDFDKLYAQNIAAGAMLVPCGAENDSVSMGGSVDDIIRILFQSSDGNLNFIAQCKCGHMKGNYNIGQKCPVCKTEVRTSFADEINIHAWVEIPENVPPFLHPVAYRILDKWIGSAKKRKTSILDCILDVEADIPEPLNKMFTRGGMQFFYDNFKDIIAYIANSRKGAKARGTRDVLRFLEEYGKPYEGHPYGSLFCRHIPILNQSLHILTHSGSIIFNDESSKYILQTCLEMHELIKQMIHHPSLSENMKEQHIYATYKSWMEYTNSVIKDKIQGKHGFIRKCILGARVHASGRGVIVPIVDSHLDDEIELPWKMMVGLYKLEIVNKLIQKFGLSDNAALEYWAQALVGTREDEPDEQVKRKVQEKLASVKICLDELVRECPFKGLPIIMGRNPERGAMPHPGRGMSNRPREAA